MGAIERIGDPATFASTPNSPQSFYQAGKLAADPNDWTDPHAWHFWSFHAGGSNFVFADGSVRFLSYRISANRANDVLRKLATRNGGEVVDGEY